MNKRTLTLILATVTAVLLCAVAVARANSFTWHLLAGETATVTCDGAALKMRYIAPMQAELYCAETLPGPPQQPPSPPPSPPPGPPPPPPRQ